jgi:tetratricopeptide (TPR) repeat protein
MEETGNFSIVDRNALHRALVEKEMDIQTSGMVSDETAASIGKWLGAQSILSASFIDMGDAFRFRIAVIGVETLAREASFSDDVAKDSRLNFMITTEDPLTRKTNDNPQTAYDFRRRGSAFLFDYKNYNAAIADFTSAIKLNPNDVDAWFVRGRAYYYSNDYNSAINDFSEVIRLNPKFGDAYNNRGSCQYALLNDDEAISDFTIALSINPEVSAVYNNRGLIYLERKEYFKAIDDFNKSIELDEHNTSVYYNKAKAYFYLQDIEQCLINLEKAALIVTREDPNIGIIRAQLKSVRDYGVWLN